ncbi:hypothetical protein P9112_005449 [Eukaryota sp. TZLM1-RC]
MSRRPMTSAGRALAEARASVGRVPSLAAGGFRPLPPTERPVTPASDSQFPGVYTPRPGSSIGPRPSSKATSRRLAPLSASTPSQPKSQPPSRLDSASSTTSSTSDTKLSYSDKLSILFSNLSSSLTLPPDIEPSDVQSFRPQWEAAQKAVESIKKYSGSSKTSHLFFSLHFCSVLNTVTFKLLNILVNLSHDQELIEVCLPLLETLLDDDEEISEKRLSLIRLSSCLTDMSDVVSFDLFSQMTENLTSILRAMSNDPDACSTEIRDYSVYGCLGVLMRVFVSSRKVVYNISRIVSKLSLTSSAQNDMSNSPQFLSSIPKILPQYEGDNAILVRFAFALGNLAASYDEPRVSFALTCSGIPLLMSILIKRTHHLLETISNSSIDDVITDDADVMVKLIRLVANLSINPEVGAFIACKEEIQMLEWIICSNLELNSELLHNTIACTTNLSYYSTQRNVLLNTCGVEISQKLIDILIDSNASRDLKLESARALGNLSRDSEVRNLLTGHNWSSKTGVSVLTSFLASDSDLSAACCGVLMNIAADPDHRTCLVVSGTIPLLIEVVESQEEAAVSAALKTLFNHALHNQNPFDDGQVSLLKGVCKGLVASSDDVDLLDVANRLVEFLSVRSE